MKHIARSSLIIAVFFGLEKLLGFVRQVLIARTFSLSAELDAFNAANNIPDMIFALISGGALAMAFIPVLSEYREEKGRRETWHLFSQITNLIFLITLGLSLIIALLARQLVSMEIGIAPGFGPEQQTLVVSLMRLNLIATVLFSISGLVIAGLQSHQHFLLPALAPSMYDIGALVGIVFLAPSSGYQIGAVTLPAFGLGIYGLVYGVILGSALFLLVQIPGLIHFQFQWSPGLKISHPGVQKVLQLMGPRVITVLFIQLVFITQDNLASRLPTGAVTALVYGWLFMQVPESIIGTALGTALLPTLSEQNSRQETEPFQTTLETSIQVILVLTLPAGIILSILLPGLISILNFDAVGTSLVVWTARAYMLGLVGHSLLEVASRSFYARQNALLPLITSGVTLAGFILTGWLFSSWIGAPGIGLANSLVFSLEALALFLLLYRRLPRGPRLKSAFWRACAAGIIGGGLSCLLMTFIQPQELNTVKSIFLTGGIGLVSLTAILPFLLPEIKALLKI